ncbi:MAG: hypothetical protein CSA54_02710 [Gammaproteobacteria bacterium]|nr:MAG: hypothetical protein CSA54_02710 [Gammaproteobacteria bacterium]
MTHRIRIILISLLVLGGTAQAQSKYIKDVWKVSLYAEADSRSSSLGLFPSGTQLEVLAEQGIYSQVKTSTGEQGWVKSSYLVDEPTYDIKLAAAERTIAALKQKIQVLRNNNASTRLQAQLKKLQADNAALRSHNQQQNQQLQALQAQLKPELAAEQRKQMLVTLISIGVVALLCGLVVGKRMTEAKVKARFNGEKVW